MALRAARGMHQDGSGNRETFTTHIIHTLNGASGLRVFSQDPTVCQTPLPNPIGNRSTNKAQPHPVLGATARRSRGASASSSTLTSNQPPPQSGEALLVLLRKEVIQPHLPVRLPCYDFVPIASPTFDHSIPHGLSHGLRVLPTFVT